MFCTLHSTRHEYDDHGDDELPLYFLRAFPDEFKNTIFSSYDCVHPNLRRSAFYSFFMKSLIKFWSNRRRR